jgi:hypothetical protein
MDIPNYGERIVQDTSERFCSIHHEQLGRYDEILRTIDELPSPLKEETLVRLLMEGGINSIIGSSGASSADARG